MEYLVPIGIVLLGIAAFLLFRRRPTVLKPPDQAGTTGTDQPPMSPAMDKALASLIKDLDVKGKPTIQWTVRRSESNVGNGADLRLASGADADKLAEQLLARFGARSLPADAPEEASLQYPGSTLILSSFDRSQGTATQDRYNHKATLATDADPAQVLAWYQDYLMSHGWQPIPAAVAPPASAHEYRRGSEHFRLGLSDPAVIRPIVALPIPDSAKTVFEVEYSNAATQPG